MPRVREAARVQTAQRLISVSTNTLSVARPFVFDTTIALHDLVSTSIYQLHAIECGELAHLRTPRAFMRMSGVRYGPKADMWALGVVIYEVRHAVPQYILLCIRV